MAIIDKHSKIIQTGDIAGDLVVVDLWGSVEGKVFYSVVRCSDGLRMHYNHDELMKVALEEEQWKLMIR